MSGKKGKAKRAAATPSPEAVMPATSSAPATPSPRLLPEVTLEEWSREERRLATFDHDRALAERTDRVAQMQRGHLRFDAARRDQFLAALEQCGNVSKAARVIGIDRGTAYDARDADEAFKARWEAALAVYADKVRAKVGELATEGVLKPILYQGRIVAYERVISERMLELEAKRVDPSYRDKDPNGAAGTSGGGPQVNVQIVLRDAAPSLEAYVASLPPEAKGDDPKGGNDS